LDNNLLKNWTVLKINFGFFFDDKNNELVCRKTMSPLFTISDTFYEKFYIIRNCGHVSLP